MIITVTVIAARRDSRSTRQRIAILASTAKPRNTAIADRAGTRNPSNPGITESNQSYGPVVVSRMPSKLGSGPSDITNETAATVP